MANYDIIKFSSEGEKILGVVIYHCENPLEDFYVLYADYALHKVTDPDEDAEVIIGNVIIPACDEALAAFRLKRQRIQDLKRHHREIDSLLNAIDTGMYRKGNDLSDT